MTVTIFTRATAAAMTSRTRSATTLVSGPGAAARRTPSMAWTGWTSRVVEARNASVANGSSSTEIGRSVTSPVSMTRRRVIESSTWSLSGGVTSVSPSSEQTNDCRGPFEHAAVRRDEQRLVGAVLLARGA